MNARTISPQPAAMECRILAVENERADAVLMEKTLREAGIGGKLTFVERRDQVEAELDSNAYDIVLADYNLRSWKGSEVIEIVRRHSADTPVIVVSGSVGEEKAIEFIRTGAAELVLKSKLERLPQAVAAAMRQRPLLRAIHAQNEIIRLLMELNDLEEGRREFLRTIVEHMSWQLGVVWHVDGKVLRAGTVWPAQQVSPGQVLSSLPPQARRSAQAVFDTGRANYEADIELSARHLASYAFPLRLEHETLGVAQFFAPGLSEPEPKVQEVFAAIGRLKGLFVSRVRANQRIAEQQQAIQALSTPVLLLRPRLLMVPLIGAVNGERAAQLTAKILAAIRHQRARAVVIDLTGAAAMDQRVANTLVQTAEAARLLGAEVILTGISTEIARTLTQINVPIGKLKTVGDLSTGIEEAESLMAPASSQASPREAGPRQPRPEPGGSATRKPPWSTPARRETPPST